MRVVALLLSLAAAVTGLRQSELELTSDIRPVSIPRVMDEAEFARAELALAVRSIPSTRGIRPKFFTH